MQSFEPSKNHCAVFAKLNVIVDSSIKISLYSIAGYEHSRAVFDGPFPSSLVHLFQCEFSSETILMKMTLICMKMKLHAELIFI